MDDHEICVTGIQYIEGRLGVMTSGPSIVHPTPEQKKDAAADSRAHYTAAKAAHERLSSLGTTESMSYIKDQVAHIGAKLAQLDEAIKAWEK